MGAAGGDGRNAADAGTGQGSFTAGKERAAKQRLDRERLKGLFQGAFDQSVAEQLFRQPDAALDRWHTPLGAGAHFRAWRLRAATGDKGALLPLVFKRSQPSWGNGPEGRHWAAAVTAVMAAGVALVPPLAVVHGGPGACTGSLGIVMPFAEAPLAAAALHWQPVAETVAAALGELRALGFTLGDVPQGGCWQGIPFIYDLSDLSVRST